MPRRLRSMRGVLSWGSHVPHRRLDRTTISAVAGGGGGKGIRAVASYDEDTTTMGVAAARAALGGVDVRPAALWFSTTTPTYLDKTNATAVHAALRLDRETAAYDAGGAARAGFAAVSAAIDARTPPPVVASDPRGGRPGGSEEATAGDAAAAVLFGDDADGPVLAEILGRASLTEEFLDRWRVPGDPASRTWEERFGETRYVPLAQEALKSVLGAAGLDVGDVTSLVIAGLHERACAALAKKSGVAADRLVDRLTGTVGNPGAAQPLLLLAGALESAAPGAVIVVLSLADGVDALALRVTDAIAAQRPAVTVAAQVSAGAPVSYGRYLAWRGLLPVEPPRRPEPARPSASAAGRNSDWKFGLTGPAGGPAAQRGGVPPSPTDNPASSPSPPVVFAVVDFDDGERLPVELTDVDAADVAIGMRVEMTFRRLFTADGIANYFWKARPVRGGES